MPNTERIRHYENVLGDWTIVRPIAWGSNGTVVYQIQRKKADLQETCALKAIPLISGIGSYDALSLKRQESYHKALEHRRSYAVNEVRLMSKLQGQTNIVSYFDYAIANWETEHGYGCDLLIRMQKLNALREEINTDRAFSQKEILQIGRDICKALVLCHKKNILHRDIKPENIFLSDDGDYKLGDFGISRILEACTQADFKTKVGTPEYAAPEQYLGNYDVRADIYSLGIVLYELSNDNLLPFAQSKDIVEEAVEKRLQGVPMPLPAKASRELSRVILKACAYKAEDRYQTAEAFLAALKAVPDAASGRGTSADLNVHKTVRLERKQGKLPRQISIPAQGKQITIPVPSDARDGQQITVLGAGKFDGWTGIPGDLIVTLQIEEKKCSKWLWGLVAAVLVFVMAIFLWPEQQTEVSWETNMLAASALANEDISGNYILEAKFLDTTEGAPDGSWDVSEKGNRSVLAWLEPCGGIYYTLYIAGDGGINGEQAAKGLFDSYELLKHVYFYGNFHTETTTDMSGMFANCHSLQMVDIETLNTSRVKNVDNMFLDCWNLFKLEWDKLDFSSVESYDNFWEPTMWDSESTWHELFEPAGALIETAPVEWVNPYADLVVSDTFTFGSYEQDCDAQNGQEPIEWVVLAKEGDKALVVSTLGLDSYPYDTGVETSDWSSSFLREWLNDTFYQKAFAEEERKFILETQVVQHQNAGYPNCGQGPDTLDRIFLLSAQEYSSYLHDNPLIDMEYRCGTPTDYCLKRGISLYNDTYCWWWLRTSSKYNTTACNVTAYGSLDYGSTKLFETGGMIRPAMWIDLADSGEAADKITAECDHVYEIKMTAQEIPSDVCVNCGHVGTEHSVPLIQFKKLRDTNGGSQKKDVLFGDFKSDTGENAENAIKFWVADMKGYTNTESVDFYLGGAYTAISNRILAGEQCDANANMTLRFYGDGKLLAEIKDIGAECWELYIVEVDGVQELRVECTTDTPVFGHCILQASVQPA